MRCVGGSWVVPAQALAAQVARGGVGGVERRQRGGDAIVAVEAGDLLDEIDLAGEVGAAGRHAAGDAGAVAGRGHAERYLRRARARGVAGRLLFLPSRPMIEQYAAADALVHPSYHDGFGFVVLEAMACGLPAVVSREAGASEIVDPAGAPESDTARLMGERAVAAVIFPRIWPRSG